jgi:YfiH family protein
MSQQEGANVPAPGFAERGVVAFTTTREAGSFNLGGREAAGDVVGRWEALRQALGCVAERLASAHQVHGDRILEHESAPWRGWLRADAADGHFSRESGTAMAVTVADCVPVFMADRSRGVAVLHSGWKGTASRIVDRAIDLFQARGAQPADLLIHLGPAICGRCYLVGPDVFTRLTGQATAEPAPVDLRGLIASQARSRGVRDVSVSPWCTRCHNDRFYSHRAGDEGRQLGVIALRWDG